MFGGLEIKGASKPAPAAANGDEKKSAAAPAAPAPSSSAFAFMGSSPAPAPGNNDAASAPASAFSFMGADKPAAAPAAEPTVEKKEPASAVSSAFSFLTEEQKDKQEPPEKPAPASSFDFMSGSTPAPAATPAPAPASEPNTAAGSGFAFLTSQTEAPKPKSNDTSKPAISDPAPAKTEEPKKPPASDLLSTANPSQPVGTGVVFGGAISKATRKPTMNRRRRTQHIGAGAKELPPPPPATSSTPMTMRPEGSSTMPPPSTLSSSSLDAAPSSPPSLKPPSPEAPVGGFVPPSLDTSAPSTTSTDHGLSSADASLEAARRAEEFMMEKMRANSSQFSAPPTPPSYSRKDPTSPQDDDYAEAKAAALEAKAQMAKSTPTFRMGGLFKKKGWGSGGGTMERNSSWNSSHSGKSIPEPSPPQFPLEPKQEETAVERLQREQEEIKRAVAERTLAMNQNREEHPPTTQPKPVVEAPKPVIQPKPAPPPPKKKTPKEKLDDLIQEFSRNSLRAMDRVAHLRQQRHKLLEERTAAETKLLLATQQISQAETQQSLAVEEEDFDLADRLAAVLDKWEREKTELGRILENIGRALKQLNDQRKDVVGAVAECFRHAQAKLKDFQNKEENTERKDDTEAMRRFSAISKQLSAENERLNKELKHIERDEALVAEERSELDNAIGEHTESMEKQRLDASQKLQTVQDEIEELRERLAAREAVANQLQTEVEGHDAGIARVKSSFSRQIARVQRKEASVKENHTEWKAERAKYEKEKEDHEIEVKAHSEALLTHDELMKRLQSEISIAETLESVVAKEVVFESADTGSGEESNEDGASELSQLQNKVVEGEAAVDEANQRVKSAEAVFEGLNAEHKSLVARIPMLESQKKAAAARRDFKAAGKANKEIKDATARLKDCEGELQGEAATRVQAAKDEMDHLEADLEAKKSVMHEKEKEQGVTAMADLASTIRRLISTRKKVCGEASDKNSVQAIGVLVLNGQIKALQKEGEIYGAKFGGWETLMDEIYEEGDDASRPSKEGSKGESSGEATEEASKDTSKKGELSKVKIAKYKELTQRINVAEPALEAAIEMEDYDKAAELQMVFEELQADLEELGLSDSDMEAIAQGDTQESEEERVETDDVDKDENVEVDNNSVNDDADEGAEQAQADQEKEVAESSDQKDGKDEDDTDAQVDAKGDDEEETEPHETDQEVVNESASAEEDVEMKDQDVNGQETETKETAAVEEEDKAEQNGGLSDGPHESLEEDEDVKESEGRIQSDDEGDETPSKDRNENAVEESSEEAE